MKYATSVLLASAGLASALTQQCSATAKNENNNWFCGAVSQILYQGFRGQGNYKAVTDMTPSGECRQTDKAYNGPLAPLDEGLSLHFRGPLQLKQVAIYNLGPQKKRDESELEKERQEGTVVARHPHGHQRLHRSHRVKRADIVTATINGKVVTWENNYFGPSPTAKPVPAPQPAPKTPADAPLKNNNKAPEIKSDKPPPSGSDWDRVAYYNAEKQVSENIMFMGNYGGQGSGVWDKVWGNSLSYLNAQGDAGSASPQTLKDMYIPSDKEFAIFSAEKCDASCGYSRVPSIAYKGFGGANKVFLFEFKMPSDGKRCPPGQRPGSAGCLNPDMPAIWALNAAIPRVAQYNKCSCWPSGCGEADIYEVLAPGDTKCKSTFHMARGASSSDYFDRPVSNYIKVATVFHEKTASVSIKRVPDNVDFSKGLDDKTVMAWLSLPNDKVASKLSSLFQVA